MEVKEWSSPYNSFNSMKGLMYIREYEGIAKDKFLPPIEASIAPFGNCNLNCEWCNSRAVLNKKPQMLEIKRLKRLVKDWLKWGVKGFCFAGTGEPSMYPPLMGIMEYIKDNGGETSIITNGTMINEHLQFFLPRNCKWIGISMDAGTATTYAKVKRTSPEMFNRLVNNVRTMVKLNRDCQISLKFLFHPDNCHEIYRACKLAKDIGVVDFHIRPFSTGFEGVEEKHFSQKQIESINRQIAKCFKLEDENFRVYGVRHKFAPDFGVANNFNRCLASPLLLIAESDGYAYLCLEFRGIKKYRLCKLEDVRKFWGSKKHLDIIKKINPKRDCLARCTMTAYNSQIENCVIEDKMCRRFP
jgi:sulfatase maturation enzyme AslB (radical SAM superfamily)